MNTAKLIESLEADKFLESRIVVNDKGDTGVLLILNDQDPNAGIIAQKYFYDITSIEVYDGYFTINYTWTKIQLTYSPTQEQSGERSLDVDIDQFILLDSEIDREIMSDYYLPQLRNYLEAYVQPDYL